MKHIKLFENFKDNFKNHFIDGKYLYHYTLVDNMDSIDKEGLIPNKNPNYKKGINAVFLTNKSSLSKANLPSDLISRYEEFYNEFYEDDEDFNTESIDNEDRPIIRLTIDVTDLNFKLFFPDDDYMLNLYGWNKATTFEEQLIESLDIWGSIAYKGIISPDNIVDQDFDYFS